MEKLESGSVKYWVKVVRPIVQVAVVQVEAANHEEAAVEATAAAAALEESQWIGDFDNADYTFDVQEVREGPYPGVAYADSPVPDDEIRYLFLGAALEEETGTPPTQRAWLANQPWLARCPDLALLGHCQSWLNRITGLSTHASERIHEKAGGKNDKATKAASFSREDQDSSWLGALEALQKAGVLDGKRQGTTDQRAAARRARMVIDEARKRRGTGE